MRYPIETAPKNGHSIVLEDEASGSFEVARWSTETDEWIGEYGEASQLTPSHWYPCYSFYKPSPSGIPLARPATAIGSALAETVQIVPLHERRGTARWWIAAMVIAGAIGGVYLQRTMLNPRGLSAPTALEGDVAKVRSRTETTGLVRSRESSGASEVAQRPRQSIENETAELRQSLQQEHDRAESLATELAQVRQAMEEKKAIAVEDSPAVKQSAGVAPEQGEQENRVTETGRQRRRAVSQSAGPNCQQYRTYNPSSGTYRGYDGQVHTCQ
ncbi:BA14K family protein [Bradyrhizobium sp. Ec3.3]|uniref:BA14K family protein n=1 Tax=Bradyrhizobium sp. Ec3.3 TaxID=189753 RepID=UPI00047F7921|nr:BA14K family protein [Bradyrhizobium sp. Ec3.3]